MLAGKLAFEVSKADHLSVGFVPEPELNCFQAAQEIELRGDLKERVGMVASLKVVIWNHWVEVMDMMESNVSREPLHNSW